MDSTWYRGNHTDGPGPCQLGRCVSVQAQTPLPIDIMQVVLMMVFLLWIFVRVLGSTAPGLGKGTA